jgi:hypothetical protein
MAPPSDQNDPSANKPNNYFFTWFSHANMPPIPHPLHKVAALILQGTEAAPTPLSKVLPSAVGMTLPDLGLCLLMSLLLSVPLTKFANAIFTAMTHSPISWPKS